MQSLTLLAALAFVPLHGLVPFIGVKTSLALDGRASRIRSYKAVIVSTGTTIRLEEFCRVSELSRPAVIFLHGSGGPESKNLPYRDVMQDLTEQGYCVYVPYYLDSTGGSGNNPPKHYSIWVQVVEDTVKYIAAKIMTPPERTALVGYSLGASVALATAAKDPRFAAVVEFSGSLPDEYFRLMRTLPPLQIIHRLDDQSVPAWNATQLARLCKMRELVCDVRLYPREGHFFSNAAMIRAKRGVEGFLKDHVASR